MQLHLFAPKRFHVLLNSLFKVLCNFPSRYLFAIGLVIIFSLTRGLPRIWAALSSNPTLRKHIPAKASSVRGFHPLRPVAPLKGTSEVTQCQQMLPSHHRSYQWNTEGFGVGLFPVHSPLLGKSLLVSFPPLTYMLKFSGLSRLS